MKTTFRCPAEKAICDSTEKAITEPFQILYVVLHLNWEGRPVWQQDYETFVKTVGFETKLCKPRHPFTKGKVEQLIRFVKDNFLADRVFYNIIDLNLNALAWCNSQNETYHRTVDGVPQRLHVDACNERLRPLPELDAVRYYLCPERKISFDGFLNYEVRWFCVPYSYLGTTTRIMHNEDTLYIYSLHHMKVTVKANGV